MWTINGGRSTPAASPPGRGWASTEVWRFTSDLHHPVHLHLAHFQVLSRGGRRPAADRRGLEGHRRPTAVRGRDVLVRFDGYRGRYVFHCHNLEHEDMAMMANFEVV